VLIDWVAALRQPQARHRREPRQVCRRLKLLKRWSLYDQEDEQICAGSSPCAMRIVFDHERDRPSRWAAVVSIAEKIGCVPQTLHEWVKKAEVNSGKGAGVPAEVADMVKASFLICHVMGGVLLRHLSGSGAGERRPASRYYRGNWRSHFTFSPFFKLVSTGKS